MTVARRVTRKVPQTVALQAIGVVFRIDSRDKARLDAAEGRGQGYNEQIVSVQGANCAREVFTYLADPDSIDPSLKPYTWYKDFSEGSLLETARSSGKCTREQLRQLAARDHLTGLPIPSRSWRKRRRERTWRFSSAQ